MLDIAHTMITDDDVKKITSLSPNLKGLVLDCCNEITDTSLSYIAQAYHNNNEFSKLRISYCHFDSLIELECFTSLNDLGISGLIGLTGIETILKNNANLENLYMNSTPLTHFAPYPERSQLLESLFQLHSLQDLVFGVTSTGDVELKDENTDKIVEGLELSPRITQLQNLNKLVLSNILCNDKIIWMLNNMPSLTSIDLTETDVSISKFDEIAKFGNLNQFELSA
eukprot:TRINITY_DN2906_c0_g1_i2.p1 TRINITY_DN2906_c0_g1~~TRINITY_DN2906_c0_g1_i2.p1  ORF type:complete len:226 (+),score=27.04 TRINITY_DN2906_c0_g1_i2:612-1289(+)